MSTKAPSPAPQSSPQSSPKDFVKIEVTAGTSAGIVRFDAPHNGTPWDKLPPPQRHSPQTS